jgi:putative tryptophan/tyrosine transport system substrate-binding protein
MPGIMQWLGHGDDRLRRRSLLTVLGGAAAVQSFGAAAQQPVPVVGFLFMGDPEVSAWWLKPFREGMAESGFVEGRNLAVEHRWAKGDVSLMPKFAADLVSRRVAVIVAVSEPSVMAAKQATATIPIVFNYVPDPVGKQLVKSFAKPGGNITGVGVPDQKGLEPKRLQQLHQVIPAASRIGYLVAEQDAPSRRLGIEEVAAAGKSLGVEVVLLKAGRLEEIDSAFATARQRGISAILVQSPSTFLYAQQKRVLEAAARHELPIAAGHSGFAARGAVFQYGSATAEVPYLTGKSVARILNGQNPAELPVEDPTRTELILNLKIAKKYGLIFPPAMLASADEIIE